MKNGKKLAKDCLRALVIGFAAAVLIAVLLLMGGMIFGESGIVSGLETMKNGLLILFSLGPFLLAGLLMAKGKKPEVFHEDNGWKNHFNVLGPKVVLAIICVVFLVLATVADYLLLMC